MKIIIAISLSFLVFFQSVGLGMTDIFLFGRFVEHAEYHSENYGDDFFTFFEKHYGSLKTEHQKNHKEEDQEHEELPFQHISCHHVLTDVVLVPFEIPILKAEINTQKSHTFRYQNLYSSLEKFSIFQPPKFV
ncbi:hypothetical protein [Aequorivita antarctica]|uniref:Uncharacterized protein n=1 Tax=Aequorivita antarctica TaxID=153266 RepID=A0A5C6YXU7_9FLAO|nr:hypothetical protein [Aequorivita antarctica]TXD71953.1 hypothetical protein ESU54_14385 [Aequorivita antarctica]SRX72937.1 hypothetical protein AEQU3_00574 [Aequorivita antarctica]